MKKIEREALLLAITTERVHVSREELAKLDSEDFKLGYQRAVESLAAKIRFITTADGKLLRQSMRTWE